MLLICVIFVIHDTISPGTGPQLSIQKKMVATSYYQLLLRVNKTTT
jgi:hypothetical protein